jgi:hypothetical protein
MTERPGEFVTPLDTVDFDQLVELGRGEIPRYAGDWTDHNLHDPGMTLLDLLAWIVDQQVYRVGLVGGRHGRAFAALLGQQPEGPRAAHGVLWPTRPLSEGRTVQRGSPVVCMARPALPFVLGRTVYLTSARLVGALRTVDGRDRPVPEADVDGVTCHLREERDRPVNAVTLFFDHPPGRPDDTTPVSFGFDVVAPPGAAPAPNGPPWGPVRYEYRVGGKGPWTTLPTLYDGTLGMAASGEVLMEMPAAAPSTGGAELRISFEHGFFPVAPRLRAIGVNVLPAIQWEESASGQFATHGTGEPDQRVDLDTGDLVASPRAGDALLEVMVNSETWTVTEDLSASGPDDPHLEVRADHLLFGNGLNGRCPAAGAVIGHRGLIRTAGISGNVRPGLTWQVPALADLMADYGTNRHRFAGGQDRTTSAELVARARDAATRRQALVTNDDVVRAAYALPGLAVGRAEVIPRFDPRLPDRSVDGVRTLVVAPLGYSPFRGGEGIGDGLDGNTPAGVPAAYIRAVASQLGCRRLLGERLVIQGPVVVMVELDITVTIEPWASFSAVRSAVVEALDRRLAMVKPHSAIQRGDEVPPWPLGRDLTGSEVRSIVAGVQGVATVPEVRMARLGTRPDEGPVKVPRDGVVVSGKFTVVRGAGGGPDGPVSVDRRWDR